MYLAAEFGSSTSAWLVNNGGRSTLNAEPKARPTTAMAATRTR
jgi:TctA family transporter